MITSENIVSSLAELGISSPPALMVHSSVRACLRVEGRTPTDKLRTIVEALRAGAGNGVLMMPTFTYSFCNHESFDVAGSPSTVGALTEYFRTLPGVRRTKDPLFSVAVSGDLPQEWEQRLFSAVDIDCFGEHSVFSYLREVNALFLFFGVDLEACTFIHHIEQRHRVSYRFIKDFRGVIEDHETRTPVTASYFVRPLDGDVEVFLKPLETALLQAGLAKTVSMPHGPRLLVTDARSIEEVAVARLRENPSFLLRRGHDPTCVVPR